MSTFVWPTRVYWEDTDAGGIVYYANYLRYLERARTEWLRSLGFVQSDLARERGIAFTVVSLTIDYRRPARLDDALTVSCTPSRDGAATLRFDQRITRGADETLVSADVRVACVDAVKLRPTRMPDFLVDTLFTQAQEPPRHES